jgi:hypothetical protein
VAAIISRLVAVNVINTLRPLPHPIPYLDFVPISRCFIIIHLFRCPLIPYLGFVLISRCFIIIHLIRCPPPSRILVSCQSDGVFSEMSVVLTTDMKNLSKILNLRKTIAPCWSDTQKCALFFHIPFSETEKAEFFLSVDL